MNGNQNFIIDAIRTVFGVIDWILFLILEWTYNVFFDITTVEFFSNETIYNFFSRIQLILGVFMAFKLAISILQAIVNPDLVSDKKSGTSDVIKRVVVCLALFTVIVPMNLPNPKNKFETQINNNGILFGTLYSLQYRIMQNNTLGQLVLGTDNTGTGVVYKNGSNSDQANNMKSIGKTFTATILKGFVTLRDTDKCRDSDAGKSYANADATTLLMDHLNSTCKVDGKDKYALEYKPLIGGVVAAVFAYLLIGFSIDIAVRALKLAVLRLIAPIPILSYLDPNQEKKGAFANWVKILTATYLDLFVRLAIIFFVVFLISDISENGLAMTGEAKGIEAVIVFIVVCFGLFFFAKQAPKFIKDALGLQNIMPNIGLSALLGGTAMAIGGGGLSGFAYGAVNGAKANAEGAASGKPVPVASAWSQNRDLMAKIRTGDKDAQGGILGRTQDFLNYQAREKALGNMEMSKRDLANAKYEKDMAEEQAGLAQQALDFATQKLNSLGPNATDQERKDARDAYQAAYNANNDAQTRLAKATKAAKQIEDVRGQMGVAPDARSTKRTTYRSATKVSTASRVFDSNNNPVNDSVLSDNDLARYTNDPNYKVYDRAVDANGKFIDGNMQNATYQPDVKNFSGKIDDSPFSGSHGTGAPGSQGGPPGPPPGPRP